MDFNTVLVDLDCLLDTRLATLYQHFPDKFEMVIPLYHQRIADDFPGLINYYDFKKLYSKRNKETLRLAVRTNIPIILKDFIDKSIASLSRTINPLPPKILLNIYPYILDEEEVKLIVDGLITIVGTMVDIEVISFPEVNVIPSFLKHHISLFVKHDYYLWLDEVTKVNKTWSDKCSDVKMMIPAIFPMEHKNINKIMFIDGQKIDPFNQFRIALEPIIDIEFINVNNFNAVIDDSDSEESESSEIG